MDEKTQHIFETIRDRQPDPTEEIVSALTFPGVDFIFQVSREELFDGEWIFRIYNFTLTAFDEISKLKYNLLREHMMKAFAVYEQGDMLALKVHLDTLISLWKSHEFKVHTKQRLQKDGINLAPGA
jgi:hypothetical protein